MQRIIVFGNSGSGKSTLAKKLQQELHFPHLDLDILAWTADTTPTRKPFDESKKEISRFLSENKKWIIEGCYADLLDYVIQYADEVLFLNLPIETCVEHCLRRPWEPHKYTSKEEQDKNIDILIEWVKQYDKRDDEFSLKAHNVLFEGFSGKKTRVKDAAYFY